MEKELSAPLVPSSSSNPIQILLIEDNDEDALLLQEFLGIARSFFYHIFRSSTLQEGIELFHKVKPDIILSDLTLPDSRGYDTFRTITQAAQETPIVLLTCMNDELLALRAIREGVQDYLVKTELSSMLLTRAICYAIERKRIEEELRVSQERYHLAVQGANDGIWDWDLKTNRIYFSPRWKAMLGYLDNEIPSQPVEWLKRIHIEDFHKVHDALTMHLTGASQHFEIEYRILHKSMNYLWVLARGLVVRDKGGKPSRIAGSQTDVTSRKRAEEQLLFDAFHDNLTGLPNRALFMDRLTQALERKKRRNDYLFAVLFLDLDRFKVINDSLGHPIGDKLLIACARILEKSLRSIDTVSRLGGDEFILLLDDIKHVDYAQEVAERIQQTFRSPMPIEGHNVVVSASIGIVHSTLDHDNPDDIIRDADTAMYKAKTLGRACHAVFESTMRQRMVTRLELENDLRTALENQELQVHYQPIITFNNWKILGFEALLRWKHPKRGSIPPKEFIPVAEETGLIDTLGMWVLRQACNQMQTWHHQYPIEPPLNIHVNISRKQFNQPDLVDNIQKILSETSLDPRCLSLEITESLFVEYDEIFNETLARLTKLGIKLQIDDFGTGYSSFNYLQRLPVSSIKIDSIFVAKMKFGNRHTEIVRSIVNMAHSLGMEAIAEGVETEEQLTQLQSIDCNCGQGFYISRPVSGEFCKEILRRTKGTGQIKIHPHKLIDPVPVIAR
jgi:diguanylate cyclase (GGDEF)-like protein/PAS domain S-box-containing protein